MDQGQQGKAHILDINRVLLRIGILVATAVLAFFALILPISTRPFAFQLNIGEVSQQDIQAPFALSYTSEVMTEQLRDEAEVRVSPVYLQIDPTIARQQMESLRATFSFIATVRADAFASPEQKLADLSALENIQLSREEAERILLMSDGRWFSVQEESFSVLEQVMRNTIREGQAKDAQRNLPTLISFTLPQDQAQIVIALVSPFVAPNSLYSDDLTGLARREARERIEPVTRTYVSGETIVRRGQIITPATWEALSEFGLIENRDSLRDFFATGALIVVMSTFTGLYFTRRNLVSAHNMRSLVVMAITFLVFLYFARLIIPNRTIIPYLYPIPAFGLTITSLFSAELGLVFSLVLSILAGYGLPNSLDLTLYYTLSSLFGILVLGKGLRIGSFFWSGIAIGAAGSALILAYRLPDPLADVVGITTLIGAAFFNGVASASLTLILQFLFAQLLGLATALQLLEISRPDHPLQQLLLRSAPGSYQHSLQVAVLAEQAAEHIGADPLLVRVGAIYHDAGKLLNPSFFIENQVPGKLNPHDDLDPLVSAQTIIRHVTDSVHLARKYRLPNSMIDFMREHHGTLMTRYQYVKAVEQAGNDPEKVDVNLFRYPGPRPQSRETALLMLADGCQARARAELPQDDEELRVVVHKVIEFCQREGQLDDTGLTLGDLSLITNSFVKTLRNTYHPRIRYPEMKPVQPPSLPPPNGEALEGKSIGEETPANTTTS
jgi:cyclic-di-AMP phosphodiesterase PgpH